MTVILDPGGVTALASDRAILKALRLRSAWPPVVPAAVLAESLTGDQRKDFHTNRLLRLCMIQPVTEIIGRHVLVSPALGTDGISVLWDFSRTDAGVGLIEGGTGQSVIREIVQDYLRYVGFASDDYPDRLELKPFEPTKVVIDPYRSWSAGLRWRWNKSRQRGGHAQGG